MSVVNDRVERARYDFETAKAMLAAERYLYVLFCCQQATEKAREGLIALRTKSMPPRLHNLIELAKAAAVSFDDETAQHLRALTNAYIQSRYPAGPVASSAATDCAKAAETVRATEETLTWLFDSMKT